MIKNSLAEFVLTIPHNRLMDNSKVPTRTLEEILFAVKVDDEFLSESIVTWYFEDNRTEYD